MVRRILLRYFLPVSFVLLTASALAQKTANLDQLKDRISTASKASDIAAALKEAERADTSLGEVISVRWHAHAVLNTKVDHDRTWITAAGIPVTGIAATEVMATVELFHSNAEKLSDDLEKWIGQLQSAADTGPKLVRAKTELGQLYEIYETQTGSRRIEDQLRKLARAQALYAEALAIETTRSNEFSPDSLAIRVFLADSYMRSAHFEKALQIYEEYVDVVTRLEGTDSPSRFRALYAVAKIAQAAGDESRLGQLRKELERGGISLDDRLDLSLRADPDNKRGEKPRGFIHIELGKEIIPSRLPVSGGQLALAELKLRVTGKFFSGIPAVVSVNPAGDVVAIEVISKEAKVKRSVESLVRKWKFRPLIYKGSPTPMKGMVYCWITS